MTESQPPTIAIPSATQSFSTQSDSSAPTDLSTIPEVPGYEIIRVVGQGAMGVVYEALDKKLHRTVALKMILMGPHASAKDRGRFKQEAEAVARLQHPGIVQIFEVGDTATGPFLALEYVAGGSLAEKLDGKPVLAEASARLIELLADAMDFAHRAGVIHRDLKPANVLIAEFALRMPETKSAAAPSDQTATRNVKSELPKITDFGLAKRLDSDQGNTASGAIMGTPSYMAPEQAEGKGRLIGPATDVYALGAILYELLTGRAPFVAATPFDTIMQVSRQEPVPPSRLNSRVPHDLETICLKCLRKEPERRYSSAAALADDLRRYQQGRPIQARAVGFLERGWRWCRRNPAVAASLLSVALALVAGTVVATYFAIAAERGEKDAKASAAAAKRSAEEANEAKMRGDSTLYAARINLAQSALRENRLIRLGELLRDCSPEHCGWEAHFLHRQASLHQPGLALTDAQLEHIGCIEFAAHSTPLRVVLLVPVEGETSALAASKYECRVHDARNGKRLFTKQVQRTSLLKAFGCGLSGDGKKVIVVTNSQALIWDVDTGRELQSLPFDATYVFELDTRGDLLAMTDGGTIKVVRVASGEVEHTIPSVNAETTIEGFEFSADRRTLYAARSEQQPGQGNTFQVLAYDLTTKKIRFLAGPYRATDATATFGLSGDGHWLAVHSGRQTVAIWDTFSGRPAPPLTTTTNKITALALSHDGRYVAVGSGNGLISLHDRFDEGATPVPLRGHHSAVWYLKFSSSIRLYSLSADGVMRNWNLGHSEINRLTGFVSPDNDSVFEPVFDRDGASLAQIVTTHDGVFGLYRRKLCVWDTQTGYIRLMLSLGQVPPVSDYSTLPRGKLALSSDGRYLAFVLFKQENLDALRNTAGLVPGLTLRFGVAPGIGHGARAVVDAGLRAFMPIADQVSIYDVRKKKKIVSFPLNGDLVHDLKFSQDGSHLLICGDKWRLHTTATGAEVESLPQGESTFRSTAFHPDGQRLALATSWRLSRGELGLVTSPVPARRMAASIEIGPIDLTRARMKVPLTDDEAKLHLSHLYFSPSGKYLAAIGIEAERRRGISVKMELPMRLLVWRCDSEQDITPVANLSFGVMLPFLMTEPMAVAFSADETMLAAGARVGSDEAEVRTLSLEDGKQRHSFRIQGNGVEMLAFTPDSRRLLAAGSTPLGADTSTAEAHVWDATSGQELLEIPLGGVLSSTTARTSAYHFDGFKLRAAGWNDKGGELRVLDGTPVEK